MTTLTAIEIATNYPDNIKIVAVQDKETLKWTSAMYLMRDGQIHNLLISFAISETYPGWDTQKEAEDKMDEMVQIAINYVNEKFGKL